MRAVPDKDYAAVREAGGRAEAGQGHALAVEQGMVGRDKDAGRDAADGDVAGRERERVVAGGGCGRELDALDLGDAGASGDGDRGGDRHGRGDGRKAGHGGCRGCRAEGEIRGERRVIEVAVGRGEISGRLQEVKFDVLNIFTEHGQPGGGERAGGLGDECATAGVQVKFAGLHPAG
jgi:hypothetical protein